MATSSAGHITHAVRQIVLHNPQSVLDVGMGFGRWGFLCREMLDVFPGRYRKEEWRLRLEGIEVYEPYVQPHHRHLYDAIHIGDAREVVPTLGEYDMVIMGDMIEHMPKEDGVTLLHDALDRARMGVLLNVPLGEEWLREIGHENVHEDHAAFWTKDDLAPYRPQVYVTTFANGWEHGCFFVERKEYDAACRIDVIEETRAADPALAVKRCADAVEAMPDRADAYLIMVEILEELGDADGALRVLEGVVARIPDEVEARLGLALRLVERGRGGEALPHLDHLVASGKASTEVIEAAKTLRARLAG